MYHIILNSFAKNSYDPTVSGSLNKDVKKAIFM